MTLRTLSGPWLPAKVTVGVSVEILDTDYRNSDRIILDHHALAGWLFDKIEPHLSEVYGRSRERNITSGLGRPTMMRSFVRARRIGAGGWSNLLQGLNERLRFWRYEPGMYFQTHYDGQYWTP